MDEGYCIEKLNNNLYKVINKELNVDIQVKIEESEDFETDLIVFNPECKSEPKDIVNDKELYQDHVIKEELVISPEEIQENVIEIPINFQENVQKKQTETYQCNKCKERFKTERSLFIHSKDVHALKLCQFCHKVFNKTSNLNRHQNYFCHKNELATQNKEMLKYGVYTEPFICDFCKKSYTHKNTLRNHIYIHMGVPKIYKCKFCEKSYTKNHNLTCHIQSVHLKAKLYSCRFCMKRFSWRFALTSHEKKHHKNSKIKT